ncbi:MAG: hypothetical protein K5886_01730 [Lachnospiraceae bacterium]|nr:hypothetical protein [Lachnospiraceae bacterium]
MFNLFSSLLGAKEIKDLVEGTKETVRLSDSQIAGEIFDPEVASEELNNDEYDAFDEKFRFYEGRKTKKECDLGEFLERVYMLVDEFEEIAPYRKMTDNTEIYDMAKKEHKKEDQSDVICRAGISFMNRILSAGELLVNSPDSTRLIINIYVYYKFITAMIAHNKIIDENDTRDAFKKFEDYLIGDPLSTLYDPKTDIASAFSAISNQAARKCQRTANMLDVRLTATLFCEVFLGLPIDFNDPANFRNVQTVAAAVFDLQKGITGGKIYEQLRIR